MLDHVQDTKAPVWEVLSHSPPYTAAHVDLVHLFSDGWHNWGKSSPLLTFLFTCWTYDPWHSQATICDQIATRLWLLTIETILRLHVLDVSPLSLSLKEWRRKKRVLPTFFQCPLRIWLTYPLPLILIYFLPWPDHQCKQKNPLLFNPSHREERQSVKECTKASDSST